MIDRLSRPRLPGSPDWRIYSPRRRVGSVYCHGKLVPVWAKAGVQTCGGCGRRIGSVG